MQRRTLITACALSLLCADLKHASEYAVVTDLAFSILRRILPGPYTIILRAGERVPRVLLPCSVRFG